MEVRRLTVGRVNPGTQGKAIGLRNTRLQRGVIGAPVAAGSITDVKSNHALQCDVSAFGGAVPELRRWAPLESTSR